MSTAQQTEPVALPRAAEGVTRPSPAPDLPIDRLYRLGLDQYLAMIDAGILSTEDRAELVEGLMVETMGKNPPHVLGTELLQDAMQRALPVGWYLSMQNPVIFPESDSELEPDAKVVRGARRDYAGRRIVAGDVGLVVEVSDTSLAYDRGVKRRIYAGASIPTYWIVNLVDGRVEAYTEPNGDDYARRIDLGPGESVALILDGVETARVAVADLLP